MPGTPGDDATADPRLAVRGRPLSSTVAITRTNGGSLGSYIKGLAEDYRNGDPIAIEFPLVNGNADTVRVIDGLQYNVVIKWLDPMTTDPEGPVFGANGDFLAYVGDGWDDASEDGAGPQAAGNSNVGWLWSNFEYVSNSGPEVGSIPSGQNLTLAKYLSARGLLAFDPLASAEWTQGAVDTHIEWVRKMVGGGWLRVVKDDATGEWFVDRSANNQRFDSSSNTRSLVTGFDFGGRVAKADDGTVLPENVVPGVSGDCSGALTPWGTIITAEENVQGQYGDVETGYSSDIFVSSSSKFRNATVTFTDADLRPSSSGEYGAHSDPNIGCPDGAAECGTWRDMYGFLTEIDPSAAPDESYDLTTGNGHQKIGAFGRARWENASFVTEEDFGLTDNRPIVMYAGNDRRGGRVYKFVTTGNYTSGMTRAQVRNLLADGRVYVAHFAGLDNDSGFTVDDGVEGTSNAALHTQAAPGAGEWLELSLTSDSTPPNLANAPNNTGVATVGQALAAAGFNDLGAFTSDDDILRALHTASHKIGARETNRPEDVEWNPFDNTLYIAFTNHGRETALDQRGVLRSTRAGNRAGHAGTIMALVEGSVASPSANPATSTTFEFYVAGQGQSDPTNVFSWGAVDNLLIDSEGGVWFGTDGNPSFNGQSDALYYLDVTDTNVFGNAYRYAATPSDAEATGPALVPNMTTLFFNVQHPGEGELSSWPQLR